MGVRASGFDIHSTTDSRDGCWVAFHLCTHDRAPPCTQPHSIPVMTFQENWGQLQGFFFLLLLLMLQHRLQRTRQQYHNLLSIHVVSSPFSGSFLLWLHPEHVLTVGAAGVLPGLVPSCTLLLADLKTGNRLGCADQDQGNRFAVAPCPLPVFSLRSGAG